MRYRPRWVNVDIKPQMSKPLLPVFHRYDTDPTPRVSHSLYNPDIKHPLIKILSKVSIRQSSTRFAFPREWGICGWIVSQSAFLFSKRHGEALWDNSYLRRWYICTTDAFGCVRRTSHSRDDHCELRAFDLFYRCFGLYCRVISISMSRVL